jgi:hypothetical protein
LAAQNLGPTAQQGIAPGIFTTDNAVLILVPFLRQVEPGNPFSVIILATRSDMTPNYPAHLRTPDRKTLTQPSIRWDSQPDELVGCHIALSGPVLSQPPDVVEEAAAALCAAK